MAYGSGTSEGTFIKNNYYSGKLLRAGDFIQEQRYVNGKQEFVNRSFHGCGIIQGLDVRMEGNGILQVSRGSAVDSCGRLLVVPGETAVNLRKLEGLQAAQGHDFILGIRYAERTVEEECSYLEPGTPYRGARIEESFALGAYTLEDWKDLMASRAENVSTLTEETVLFRDDNVELAVMTPKAVPSDSVFKCRIRARVLHGESADIDWHCSAGLQGAFFAESGQAVQLLEGEEAVFSGSVTREWEICTEENRRHPITLELTHLKIKSGNSDARELETCRICIWTASSYEDIVRKYLQQEEKTPETETGWLPLAYLKALGQKGEEQGAFAVSGEQDVRLMAFRPVWEQLYRQEAEKNGIVDIRWRGLLKALLQAGAPPGPQAPQPQLPGAFPAPGRPDYLKEQILELVREQVESRVRELSREQTEEKGERYIRRGVAVIPVPRRYHKGRTLLSEEIAHGFPGEEVLIWCGRLLEEKNYAYWSRGKVRYSVLCGDEELFSDAADSGWRIAKQAVRQNMEKGTFQVALTLSGRCRRDKSREVAISWIAVKAI